MASPDHSSGNASRGENISNLLWVDLQSEATGARVLGPMSASGFRVRHHRRPESLSALIQDMRPDVICFEFDKPDSDGLRQLRHTKLHHPSIPILMLSDPPTAELALWALRARVWDYFVKPVTVGEIARRINILAQASLAQRGSRNRVVFMPEQMLPCDAPSAAAAPKKSTAPVLNHVDAHAEDRLSLADAAARCNMSPCEFSREFKREHGMTFRDFVIRRRIALAAERLRELDAVVPDAVAPDAAIMDIALASGFNDASHFTRTFRRLVGLTPTAYRLLARAGAAGDGLATLPSREQDVRLNPAPV
jgi:AraC-like DNA-binding protein/CheY-like chemotaxis protein